MSWEHKLLHCGPGADRKDLLAHYLFISVLHLWLPRGSADAQSQAAVDDWTPQPNGQMNTAGTLQQPKGLEGILQIFTSNL